MQSEESRIGINSTITPLGIGESFIGQGERNTFPDMGVSCFSDKAGMLYFDFSINGDRW